MWKSKLHEKNENNTENGNITGKQNAERVTKRIRKENCDNEKMDGSAPTMHDEDTSKCST